MTEEQFIKKTLSSIEQENWRTVRQQRLLYQKLYCNRIKLYGDADLTDKE